MPDFSVAGFGSAPAGVPATYGGLHNPSTTKDIWVVECGIWHAAIGGSRHTICVSTQRGTAGSTVTPGADNCLDGDDAPQSGALLDLGAYSAEPSAFGTPRLLSYHKQGTATGSEGAGYVWAFPLGLRIGPNDQKTFFIRDEGATTPGAYWVYFVFTEESP